MEDKKALRARIKALKKQHTKEQLQAQSEHILDQLEMHPDFIKAERVMLYSALPDEVQTQAFLERWHLRKILILPTVVGDDIVPVEYGQDTAFAVGDFNILEPQNDPYTGGFDLIVVPGVAFDRQGNRLGRGKGYYDRFLCQHMDVKRIGICFDFQLVDEVPAEPFDIRMDEVITLEADPQERAQSLIPLCRYYKGEAQCPSNTNKLFWSYEQKWVEDLSRSYSNGDLWRNTYEKEQLEAFAHKYRVPATLLGLLYGRFMHWGSGYETTEDFYRWMEEQYL